MAQISALRVARPCQPEVPSNARQLFGSASTDEDSFCMYSCALIKTTARFEMLGQGDKRMLDPVPDTTCPGKTGTKRTEGGDAFVPNVQIDDQVASRHARAIGQCYWNLQGADGNS